MRRVVVTGLGLISSIGNDTLTTWKNLIDCKSGIKRISNFDVTDLPCKIAGSINHEEGSFSYLNRLNYLEKREINRNDRFIQYGLIASKLAIEDSGINDLSESDKLKTGVTIGSGIGGLETIYEGSLTLSSRGAKKFLLFLFHLH